MARITDYGVKGDLYNRLANFDKSKGLLAIALVLGSNLPTGQSEKYPWLGTTPSMREWIKERQINQPQAFDLQIVNKKFENTLTLPLDIINNDKTDQAQMLLSSLGDSYPLWIVEMLAALINSGTAVNAFDGVAFFGTNHNYGKSGNFTNVFNSAATAAPTAVTALEAALAINKGIELMKAFPDDNGRAIKNEAMSKVVLAYQAGTVNAAAIRTALTQSTLSSGAGSVDNPLKGQDVAIIPVASGLLSTGNTKFSLFRARDDQGKSIIFQENVGERMVSVISDPNSEYVVKNDGWLTGVKTVGNTGFGLPSDAIQGTFV